METNEDKIHIVDKIMQTGMSEKFSQLANEFDQLQKSRYNKSQKNDCVELKESIFKKFNDWRRNEHFRSFSPISIKMSRKDLLEFTKSLSIMLDSGINLVEGLVLLRDQARKDANFYILHKIVQIVRDGEPLSVAMRMFKRTFSNLYVSSIECGEETGKLNTSLNQMFFYMEREQRMKSRITQAMIYPVAIIAIAFIINSLLLVFIVPKFQDTFTTILGDDTTFPMPTQILLSIGEVYKTHFVEVVIAIGSFILAFITLSKINITRIIIDKIMFKIPIIGKVLLKDAIAKLSLTMSILLSSGIPILRAFDILSTSSNNSSISKIMNVIKKNVSAGENIATTFDFTNVFPSVMVTMIDVGEQTGRLNEMFEKVGNLYNSEVDVAIEALEATLEPLLTIVIALPIAFVVIALFMPLVTIIKNLTG